MYKPVYEWVVNEWVVTWVFDPKGMGLTTDAVLYNLGL
jgi:hypothetical protein